MSTLSPLASLRKPLYNRRESIRLSPRVKPGFFGEAEMSDTQKKSSSQTTDNLYRVKGRVSLGAAVPFGLQHLLAMLVSNITPVIIVAGLCGIGESDLTRLIQSTMVIAGIGTLIQLFPLWWIGSGLPIVMGVSFTFVSVCSYIAVHAGYDTIMGAVLIGGVVMGILGLFTKYWIRIIAPIVAACVVTALGFSLLSVGANTFGGGSGAADFGSWENWLVGGVTLIVCLVFTSFAKGFLKTIAMLIGLAAGYILAVCLGMVDFSSVFSEPVVGLPAVLTYTPKFELSAILSVICIYLVAASDNIGNTAVVANSCYDRDATDKEIRGEITGTGLVCALGSLFGCMPITAYAQNVGLIAMTKVVNRITIVICAGVLILCGFSPFLGNLLASVPQPVLGGCTIMMFGMIIVSGIEMISKAGFTGRNKIIVALSLSFGLGFTQASQMFDIFPDSIKYIFAENSVAIVFVLAILLNLILPREDTE